MSLCVSRLEIETPPDKGPEGFQAALTALESNPELRQLQEDDGYVMNAMMVLGGGTTYPPKTSLEQIAVIRQHDYQRNPSGTPAIQRLLDQLVQNVVFTRV
jgi:hypothetical protein